MLQVRICSTHYVAKHRKIMNSKQSSPIKTSHISNTNENKSGIVDHSERNDERGVGT